MRIFTAVFVALIVVGGALFWWLTRPMFVPESALEPRAADLANGRTMFLAGECATCHGGTSETDRTRLGGGLGLKTPFGTFYMPNISPDPNDGIGSWSEAQFVTALTRGTAPDGRHYYPAFPYPSFQRLRVEDARDLFAFLKTLPPVQGKVRAHEIPLLFKWRRPIGLWKLLCMDGKPFEASPDRSAQWNRGAYLANGAAHCAECHSPRNLIWGIKQNRGFGGAKNTEGEGFVPNITQKALKDWSQDDIARLLETGLRPDGERVGGQMASVVRNTSQLTPDDRAAIAAYIKSLPPTEGEEPPQKR
jgi:mono/diheme cytochrome c family protein